MSASSTQIGFVVGLVGVVVAKLILDRISNRARNPRNLPLPPGPKGLPFVGNLFQFPKEKPWEVYNEWSKTFGNVIYLEAMGQRILVLNSLEDTFELLDKRSATTSGRPSIPAFDLIGMDYALGNMDYGAEWRAHRRAFDQYMNNVQISKYHPVMEEEVLIFLQQLLAHPEEYVSISRSFLGHTIMRVAYGVKDFDYNKQLIQEAGDISVRVSDAAIQGRFLVNLFPSMRHIPSWLPGAGWKRWLEEGARANRRTVFRPYEDAKERVRSGKMSPTEYHNVVHGLIESFPPESDPQYSVEETIARNTAASVYIGGSDTTVTLAHALLLALAMYPEVQSKAQAEVDSVLNGSRLPKGNDKGQLPYIQAMVKEVSRWHNVLPFGVPHQCHQDEEYNGYFIPKGTMIFPNEWAMMHDPTVFNNPFEFDPERFLKDGQLNPSMLDLNAATFGHGRRICPGRHFSAEVLGLMTMSFLSVFEIYPKDRESRTFKRLDVTDGMISKPVPFECQIHPRSPRHVALISQ